MKKIKNIIFDLDGVLINSLKNTAHLGKGEWAVIESDESDGSFVYIPPKICSTLFVVHLPYMFATLHKIK